MESVQDLRSKDTDRHRQASTKAKWNPKWTNHRPELAIREGPDNKQRPVRYSYRRSRYESRELERQSRQDQAFRKLDVLGEGRDEPRGGYDDFIIPPECERELGSSPPDRQFDGKNFDGTAVLGDAVVRAVKKFEDVQTTKLVKEEYDDVSDLSADERARCMAEEDGFELV